MVTAEQMRLFALECLRWSEKAGNASQRDLMLRIAKSWTNTASAIERRGVDGDPPACPHLPTKAD